MARQFSKAFYNSKEWQQTRDFVLKRDKYLCQKCGAPAQEVHHIIHLSPKNINDTSITMNPKNLISLCRDCHFEQHKEDKLQGSQAYASANKSDCADGLQFDENGYVVRPPST